MQIRSETIFFPRRAAMALFALLATTCAFAGTAQADPTTDVIGGTNVSHSDYMTSYSFMVGLLADSTLGNQFCGGTLIAPKWVVSAAHCYAPEEGVVPRYVHIGSENMLFGGQTIPVAASIIHPSWNPDLLRNDIQLIKLAYAPSPATPAVRSTFAEDPTGGELATLSGWGLTATGEGASPSQFLKVASVDVIDQSVCENSWFQIEGQAIVGSGNICAIHFGTPSSDHRGGCNGDSGGPLLYNNKLIGIVSFGYVGCYDYAENVYTRVSSYKSWIDGSMAKSLSTDSTKIGFGSVDVSGATAERTLTFSSDGDQAINLGTPTTSGDFSVKSTSCGGPVPSGSNCQVVLSFDPSNTGVRGGELVIPTDTLSGVPTRVNLDGFGTGQSSTPVALKLTMPRASKVRGKKISAKFKVGFAFPAASLSSTVCIGRVKLSLKVPKLKKPVVKSAAMAWTPKGCEVTIVTSMPKRAKGKNAKATVTFAGNNTVAPVVLKKTIKIR